MTVSVLDKIFMSFADPMGKFWGLLTSLQISAFGYSIDFGHLMVAIVVLTFFFSVVIKR